MNFLNDVNIYILRNNSYIENLNDNHLQTIKISKSDSFWKKEDGHLNFWGRHILKKLHKRQEP